MNAAVARLLLGSALALLATGCSEERGETAAPFTEGATEGSVATLTAAEPDYVRGLLAARDHDFVAARYHWLRAVQLHPPHRYGQHGRSGFEGAVGEHVGDEPSSAFSNPYDARIWLLYARDEGAESLAGLVRAVRANPDLVADWSPSAADAEDLEVAVARLGSVIEEQPQSALARFQRGLGRSAMGDGPGALEDFASAIERNPDLPLPYLARGCLHLREGRTAAALLDFGAAVARDPENPFAWAQRGWCRYLEREHQSALDDLTRALGLDPGAPAAQAWRGLALFELGRSEEALRALALAHEQDPRRLFEHRPARDEAELDQLLTECAQRAGEAPQDPAAHFIHGSALRTAGRLEEAVEAFSLTLEQRPGYALARLQRGVVLAELGQDERALADLDRVVEQNAHAARALTNRGNVHLAHGDRTRARADYEAAIAIAPRFSWPYRNLGLIVRAEDPQRALELFTSAVHLDPGYAAAYRSRAAVYATLGNFPAAKNDRRMAEIASS